MQGGMGAVCRNLHNGKIKSHQIENLRKLDIDEILNISSIDPNFSFKNQLSNSRIRNLHGKFPATLEDIDYDLESEGGESEKKTRSGKSYFTDATELKKGKPILKKTLHRVLDLSAAKNALSKLGAGQKNAILRGIALARSLNLEPQKGALFENTPGMALNIYNDEKMEISKAPPRSSHNRHVKFDDKMTVRKQGLDKKENTIFEKKQQYKCYLSFVFEPMYDLSMSELNLLK